MSILRLCLVVSIGFPVMASAFADPLPTILTFEVKKQREERVAAKRDPKGFWAKQIVVGIESKKPPRTKMPAGQVVVQFVVGRDGAILSDTVARSSGQADLDRLAIEMVERAAPFPPMPAGVTDESVAFDLPLRFR